MSVSRFSSDEIGKLCKTVMMNEPLQKAYKSSDDYHTIKDYYEGNDNKFYESHIPALFDRLYIGNQAVSILQYGRGHAEESRSIDFLEDADCDGSGYYADLKEFLQQLKSLRYNLFSNGGNSFTQQKDFDAIERIESATKDILIQVAC